MVESTPPIRRVPDAALIQQLAQQEGLVRWVGRQQWRGPLSFEDARHAGRIGLGHALRRYDPARGLRFSTSAVPAIARTVWQEVGIPPAESRATVPPPTDPIEQTDPREALHQAQVVQALPALIAMLPERLRAVVVWHYGLDGSLPQTFAQIGDHGGVSRQRVQQLNRQALILLGQPAISGPVRALIDCQQRTLARQRHVARAARRGRR